MVAWHHRLNEREFEQTPGDSKGKGSQVHAWLAKSQTSVSN